MITQLLIEPTSDVLNFQITAWGLTDDGSSTSHLVNIKSDKQNITDILNSPGLKTLTPLRLRSYFDSSGNVTSIDIYDKASGSIVFTGDTLDAQTASQVTTLRQIIESKPVVKTSVDAATLKDVSNK